MIRTVTLLMLVLVLGLVAFFYGHSFIWLLRELHEKLKRRKP
jgi:H+/Cl- antiporter ClcA